MLILYKKKFEKEYQKLTKANKDKFNLKIKLLLVDLHDKRLNTHKLHGKYKDCFSINITGDIRAVFRLKENNKVIIFIDIGTHSKLYK
ncbi:type II toxin-antitoxin system mRNA interferase toxin, RelE/StbE family [Candidatus Parcubacteria bacterium]|nr:type II toxin-antitoxin system mRNA interferase toxin, RelE/StbE family [Candidatus Parcubacteria bacterium]